MSGREETNSITHLVKIVATEVCKGLMAEMNFIERLEHLEKRPFQKNVISSEDFIGKIQSSLAKAGDYWSAAEDDLLVQEVETALAQIAKNHQRSISAIGCRIEQKELI